jgi:hypothetical protein
VPQDVLVNQVIRRPDARGDTNCWGHWACQSRSFGQRYGIYWSKSWSMNRVWIRLTPAPYIMEIQLEEFSTTRILES